MSDERRLTTPEEIAAVCLDELFGDSLLGRAFRPAAEILLAAYNRVLREGGFLK